MSLSQQAIRRGESDWLNTLRQRLADCARSTVIRSFVERILTLPPDNGRLLHVATGGRCPTLIRGRLLTQGQNYRQRQPGNFRA
jgi:hypothetical protein